MSLQTATNADYTILLNVLPSSFQSHQCMQCEKRRVNLTKLWSPTFSTINRPSTYKKAKRGSGDLICYCRIEIMSGIELINGLEHTDRLWVKLNKNFVGFPKDI